MDFREMADKIVGCACEYIQCDSSCAMKIEVENLLRAAYSQGVEDVARIAREAPCTCGVWNGVVVHDILALKPPSEK